MTHRDYTKAIMYFKEQFDAAGEKYQKKPLILNLLALVIADIDDVPHLEFTNTVEVATAFNGYIISASVSNRDGVCIGSGVNNKTKSLISGGYNLASSTLSITIPVGIDIPSIEDSRGSSLKDFESRVGTTCPKQFGGKPLSYVYSTYGSYRDGKLPLSFDVRSVAGAIGRNLGIFSSYKYAVHSQQRFRGFIAYYDPWYESTGSGMDLIYCLDKAFPAWELTKEQIDGPDVCFVRSSNGWPSFNALYYPTLAQMTRSRDQIQQDGGAARRIPCSCQDETFEFSQCLNSRFTLGLIYSTSSQLQLSDDDFEVNSFLIRNLVEVGLQTQKLIIEDPENGDTRAIEHFSDVLGFTISVQKIPALASIPIKSTSEYDNTWARGLSYNQLLAEAWDKIGQNLSALVLEVDGSLSLNKDAVGLNDLPRADMTKSPACQNIFSNNAAFEQMAANPPVALVESYLSCRKTVFSVFSTALGSAVATTNLISSMWWIVCGYFIVFTLRCQNKLVDESEHNVVLTESKKEKIQEALGTVEREALLGHLQALLEHQVASSRALEVIAHRLHAMGRAVTADKEKDENEEEEGKDEAFEKEAADLKSALAGVTSSLDQLASVYRLQNSPAYAASTAERVSACMESMRERKEQKKNKTLATTQAASSSSSSSSENKGSDLEMASRSAPFNYEDVIPHRTAHDGNIDRAAMVSSQRLSDKLRRSLSSTPASASAVSSPMFGSVTRLSEVGRKI